MLVNILTCIVWIPIVIYDTLNEATNVKKVLQKAPAMKVEDVFKLEKVAEEVENENEFATDAVLNNMALNPSNEPR